MSSITEAHQPSEFEVESGISLGKMGIWWFLASEIMVFGGFIAIYVLYRVASGGAWAETSHHVSTLIGSINTVVLLTSSLTMVLAHAAVENDERRKARNYLGITVLLGVVFLCIKGIEYSTEIANGFTPLTAPFWSFYYSMTGLHGLHVLAGIVANFCLFIMAVRGNLWPACQKRVEYAGLYWHFVDVVWVFLFPLLYLQY